MLRFSGLTLQIEFKNWCENEPCLFISRHWTNCSDMPLGLHSVISNNDRIYVENIQNMPGCITINLIKHIWPLLYNLYSINDLPKLSVWTNRVCIALGQPRATTDRFGSVHRPCSVNSPRSCPPFCRVYHYFISLMNLCFYHNDNHTVLLKCWSRMICSGENLIFSTNRLIGQIVQVRTKVFDGIIYFSLLKILFNFI